MNNSCCSAKTRLIGLLGCIVTLMVPPALATPADTTGETPVILDTAYAVPTGALFVDVAGHDSNSGTLAMPFRTLTYAVDAAPVGATIVLRQGTYREEVPHIWKRLTIQPYPHEEVWLKGSIVIDDWVARGRVWFHDNWNYRFDRESHETGAIDPVRPYAGYPDMVFVDGLPLRQVGTVADVVPGTFLVDYDSKRIYIGNNPQGRLVEASAYKRGLRVSANETVIRGLGFMHYASGRFEGALQFDASKNVTVENNTFAWSASKGLTMHGGDGAVVRGNTFLNNGQMGYGSWRYDNVIVERNRFAGNNQEGFKLHGSVTEPAGAKLTVGKNWIIRDNLFENNKATGLWLDISNHNTNIVRNRVMNNLSYGIYYEISGSAIIGSNLVVGNTSGIRVSNSSDVKIYNNTIAGNTENIWIQDDSRVNDDPDDLKLGITHVTANIELRNNVLSNGDFSQSPFVFVRDYNSEPLKSADEMISICNTNAYYRQDSNVPSELISWWRGSRESTFRNLDEFHRATGHERNSILIEDIRENPFFSSAQAENYRLKPNSVAVGAGTALPPDVAKAIGVATGKSVDLGVLVLNRQEDQRNRASGSSTTTSF